MFKCHLGTVGDRRRRQSFCAKFKEFRAKTAPSPTKWHLNKEFYNRPVNISKGEKAVLNAIVVDGDKSVCQSLSSGMPWKEINVNLAACFDNIFSAIVYLEDNPADIVITDIFAPSQDTKTLIDFCADAHPGLKLILTSNTKDFSYARMAVKCSNVVDFFVKPMDFVSLAETICKISMPYALSQTNATVSGRTINKNYELFSNLVHGHMTGMDEVKKAFKKQGLDTEYLTNPCTLVHFHVNDFMSYLRANWHENTDSFYDAVCNIIPFETEDKYCSLTNYSYGNLSWFILHKTRNNTPGDLVEIINGIAKKLEDNLGLVVGESSHKAWFSLSDMVLNSAVLSGNKDKPMENAIAEALAFMRENYNKDISLVTVAEHVNISPVYFSSFFKKHTGEGFVSKLTNIRIEQAAKLLVTTNMTIRDIKTAVGYGHTGNFYKHFQSRFNMTPNEYKKWYFEKQSNR